MDPLLKTLKEIAEIERLECDLVERLRESYSTDVFLMEVAAEIERLTEIKDLAIKDSIAEAKENEQLQAEIERLRTVVEHCAAVRMCSKCADALEEKL